MNDELKSKDYFFLFHQKEEDSYARISVARHYLNDKGVDDVEIYHYFVYTNVEGTKKVHLNYQPYNGKNEEGEGGANRDVNSDETHHYTRAIEWFKYLNKDIHERNDLYVKTSRTKCN